MDAQNNDTVNLSAQVRVMQIIVGALVTGILMFGGVATTIVMSKGNPKNIAGAVPPNPVVEAPLANQGLENGVAPGPFGLPVVATLAAAMSVMMLLARFIIPSVMVQKSIQDMASRTSVESLNKADFVPIYQTTLIIASALLEGPALFNLIAFIIEQQIWSLGLAGVLALGMVAGFPTVDRVDGWTEEQLRNVQLNPPRRA